MVDIVKIQKIEENILDEFNKICESNNLTYFICGGTLLGAVRHGGFIPWDDDIDVMMPRKDWEKFKRITNQLPEDLSVMNTEITHIFNNKTHIKFNHILGDCSNYGLMIDIFPLDGQPSNKILLEVHKKKVLFLQMFIRFCNIENIEPSNERTYLDNILIKTARMFRVGKLLKKENWVRRIHNELSKYDYEESQLVGALLGSFRDKEVMPKEVFGEGSDFKFDKLILKGPNDPERYLTNLYGNYMKLPPKSERGKHHKMKVFKI